MDNEQKFDADGNIVYPEPHFSFDDIDKEKQVRDVQAYLKYLAERQEDERLRWRYANRNKKRSK